MDKLEFKNKVKELIENNSSISTKSLGLILPLLSFDNSIGDCWYKLLKEEQKLKKEVGKTTDKTDLQISAIRTNLKKISNDKEVLFPFIDISVNNKAIIKQLSEFLVLSIKSYNEIIK